MKTKHDPKVAPWQIQEQDFPRQGNSSDKLKFLLRYAVLAPSGHNTQPWKFTVREDEIDVLADKTRWSKGIDPHQRELHIAIGCALENLLVAAEHFGYSHQVVYFPDPKQEELAATVKFMSQGQPSSFRGAALFGAIPERHTNRKTYDGRSISKEDLARLQDCCVEDGIWLHITDDLEIKRQAKESLIRGHAAAMADSAFLKETGYWVRQGLFNMPRPIASLIQLAMTMPGLSVLGASTLVRPLLAMMDSRLVMSASAVAILSSSVEGYEAQVKVGQVFERICLTATAIGMRVHPMSPLTAIPELKAKTAKLQPNPAVIPQHAFRLGYAEQMKTPAQRRPIEEVLA